MKLTPDALINTARRLQQMAHPTHAIIVDAITCIPLDRLEALIQKQEVCEEDVALVVDQYGHHPLAVSDVLRSMVRFDCRDYQSRYSQIASDYDNLGLTTDQALQILQWQPSDKFVRFLLHDMIYRWSHQDSLLTDLVIEDNRRYLVAKGYLIRQNMAFSTTIELLQASCEHEWPSWRELWRYF